MVLVMLGALELHAHESVEDLFDVCKFIEDDEFVHSSLDDEFNLVLVVLMIKSNEPVCKEDGEYE